MRQGKAKGKATYTSFLPCLLSFGGLANLDPVALVVGRFGILGDQAIGAA